MILIAEIDQYSNGAKFVQQYTREKHENQTNVKINSFTVFKVLCEPETAAEKLPSCKKHFF